MLMRSFCFPPRAKRSLSRSSGRLRLCGPSLFPGRLLSAGREHPKPCRGSSARNPAHQNPARKRPSLPVPHRAARRREVLRPAGSAGSAPCVSPPRRGRHRRLLAWQRQTYRSVSGNARAWLSRPRLGTGSLSLPFCSTGQTESHRRTAPQLGRGYTLLSLGMSRE